MVANNRPKLNPEKVRVIRKCLRLGVTRKALAIDFEVSYKTIHAIAHNKTYRGIA